MQRLIFACLGIVACLGIIACDPPPQDAGEIESATESSSDGPSSGSSDGPSGGGDDTADGSTSATGTSGEPEAQPEWSMELAPDTTIIQMVRSPNGVVLVLQADPTVPAATVMEVSSSMESLWSVDLPAAWVSDLAALDDGTYVLAGTSAPAGTPTPTAWRLSCCGDVDLAMEFPVDDPQSGFVVAQPLADGLLLAHTNGTQTEVIRTTLDLVTQWSSTLPFTTYDGAPTASGTVVLSGSEGGSASLLYEIEAEGPGLGMGDGQPVDPVGTYEELVIMTPGFEQVWFEPHGGGMVVAVPIPGLTEFEYVADRHGDFGLAFSVAESMGSILHVVEFGADGAVSRHVVLPPTSRDYIAASAIAVGTDDAIYVGGYEAEPGASILPILHRLAPL